MLLTDRLFFYLLCSENLLTKLIGYQQPNCLCFKMAFAVGSISLAFVLIVFTFLQLFSIMWGRQNCVRKMVFRFACVVL